MLSLRNRSFATPSDEPTASSLNRILVLHPRRWRAYLLPILVMSAATIAVVLTPASSLIILASCKTGGLVAQCETPSHVRFFHDLLFDGRKIQHGLFSGYRARCCRAWKRSFRG